MQPMHMRAVRLFGLALLVTALNLSAMSADESADANNVVIVLDASGSMSSGMRGRNVVKMNAAKAALTEVLKNVGDDTHIGLLVFSASNNFPDPWIYPLGPIDRAKLAQAINQPQPGGGTPLGEYIKMGADRLLKQRDKQHGYGTYRLLVVTDGEANDTDLVDKFAPEIIARGITMDVIGVDMATTHTLAKKANSYRRADDPESLKRAVADVFAEVTTRDNADTSAGAFAEIAPIPNEVASKMISALASSGNSPIGEGPALIPGGRSSRHASASGSSSQGKTGSGKEESNVFMTFVLIVIGLIIVRNVFARRK